MLDTCLVNEIAFWQSAVMSRPTAVFLLLCGAAAAAACEGDSGDDAAACSTENIVDDIDDGTDEDGTDGDAAPTIEY
jgi:hypothetical protein